MPVYAANPILLRKCEVVGIASDNCGIIDKIWRKGDRIWEKYLCAIIR